MSELLNDKAANLSKYKMSAETLILLSLQQILENQRSLLLAGSHCAKSNESADLVKRINEFLLQGN